MKKPHDQRRDGQRRAERASEAGEKAPPRATHWGEVADWYDGLVGEEGSEYQREVIFPGLLRLLKLEPGMRVLDLACGQGAWARKLAGLGATVTAVDAAAALIDAARRRNAQEKLAITYGVADVTKLLADGKLAAPLEAGGVDAVTIVLAIQNMTPLSPVWQACRLALKPEGRLVVVMMHPSFRVPQGSDWLWEEATGTQPRLVRRYMTSAPVAIEMHPGRAAAGKGSPATTHFHRPLQAYVNTLGNAGLVVDHLDEWVSHKQSQAGPRKAALDAARREFPMFLALRARVG